MSAMFIRDINNNVIQIGDFLQPVLGYPFCYPLRVVSIEKGEKGKISVEWLTRNGGFERMSITPSRILEEGLRIVGNTNNNPELLYIGLSDEFLLIQILAGKSLPSKITKRVERYLDRIACSTPYEQNVFFNQLKEELKNNKNNEISNKISFENLKICPEILKEKIKEIIIQSLGGIS